MSSVAAVISATCLSDVAPALAEELLARLDTLAVGGYLLDRDGRLLYANLTGQRLLGSGTHLVLLGDRLAPARGSDAARFETALREVVWRGQRARPLCVRGPSSERSVLAASIAALDGGVLLTVHVPSGGAQGAPAVAELLQDVYELTPAEAKVAALVGSGICPKQAACHLGVTESTVRCQLKQVYAKLATDGQRGLVRMTAAFELMVGAAPA
jgi:DNA-binding CsgD family transcriptional regulator